MRLIKFLEIQGFKSFRVKTRFVFPNGLNAIVGQNGSGKSNVFDALCFVLGKASKKELRTQTFDELIYDGGKSGKPANFAKVTICLDNSKKVFPLDGEEILVSREVNKNGKSTYRINGRKANKKHILELLLHVGVDPDGYNIILQGTISRIVDVGTIERREIIEEIAGISFYEKKKDQAKRNLDKVKDKIEQVRLLLHEREKNLKSLREDKVKAEKFKRLKGELKFKKAKLAFKEWRESIKKLDRIKEDIVRREIKIKKIDVNLLKISEDFMKRKKLLEKTKEEIDKRQNQFMNYNESQDLMLKEKELSLFLDNLSSQIIQSNDRKKNLLSSINQDLNESKENEEEAKKLDSEIKGLEQELEKKGGFLSRIANQRLNFQSKLNELEKEVLEKKSEVIEHEVALKKLDQKKEYEQDLSRTKKDFERFQKIVKELGEGIIPLREKDSSLSAGICESAEHLRKIEERIAKLEANKQVMNSSMKKGVKKIIELKNTGWQGIYGTVGQLLDFYDGYELPVSVAAGGRLRHVVVEDELTAKKCIQYLRDNKCGVATFIPLNKVLVSEVGNVKAKGVVDYAANLVKHDRKFRKVVLYAFGKTLIVNDFESAQNIGMGKERMVTLNGDLFSRKGTVEGGYRSKEKMGFDETVIDKHLEKSFSEADALKEKLGRLNEERKDNDEELRRLREQKIEFSIKIEDVKQKIKVFQEHLLAFEKVDLGRVESILEKIGFLEQEKRTVSEKLEGISSSDSEQGVESLGDELSSLKIRRETLRNSSKLLVSDVSNAKSILKEIDKSVEDFRNQMRDLQSEMKEVNKRLAEKRKEERKYVDELENLMSRRKKLDESITRINDLLHSKESDKKVDVYKLQDMNLKRVMREGELSTAEEVLKEYERYDIKKVDEPLETLKGMVKGLTRKIDYFGPVNEKALEMYKRIKSDYDELDAKRAKLIFERQEVLDMIKMIDDKKKRSFMETFNAINVNFSKVFAILSKDGKAKLILENSESPFEGGLEVYARPKGKPMKSLRAMSGGEKTITALAFIFAIQEFRPAPFYILDEVDAALDMTNSQMLGGLLSSYSEKAQYIVISHNEAVLKRAHQLFGVAMNHKTGESSITSVDVKNY